MPDGAVKVDRTTRWGNPFDQHPGHQLPGPSLRDAPGPRIASGPGPRSDLGRAEAVRRYAAWLGGDGPDVQLDATGRRYSRAERLAELPALAGSTLACWCPLDGPCHADVLAARVAALPTEGAS